MKDTDSVKNYCKTEVEPYSILPRVYHITDGLWFIATQKIIIFTVFCPQKQYETLTLEPPIA